MLQDKKPSYQITTWPWTLGQSARISEDSRSPRGHCGVWSITAEANKMNENI